MTPIFTFILLTILSYLLVYLIRRYAERRQILDRPNERSSHSKPTPRGGGLAMVVLGLCAGAGVWGTGSAETSHVLVYLVCGIVIAYLGWNGIAEKLSAHAAKGEWTDMPMLITDEMLDEFCLVTEEDKLADELKKRYDGIADRLTLYSPFVPGEKDESWKSLAKNLY